MKKRSDNFAIKLKLVSKKYIIHHEKPTLAESFFKKREEFWALRDITINVRKGEKLGIIGANGSGKSTLLRIICGITCPTIGKVRTKGKIASLIDLEAGFHPDLTGEENLYLNGLLMGIDKKTLKEKFNKIVDFSGIRRFIDAPLRTYSSGMSLRLGFSIAVHSDPDILVIDEAIAAGDEDFRKKAYQKMQEFFKLKKTILFVSHNLQAINDLCPQTLWLKEGKIKMIGATKKVIEGYLKKENSQIKFTKLK